MSEAAECAAQQGQYLQMRDRLFAHHTDLGSQQLLEQATAIGLDITRFQQCLADGAGMPQVKADMDEATRLGVNSTPTFLIGYVQPNNTITVVRRLRGAVPYEVLKVELQKLW
jgi:protein-disulfide isomerase